MKYYTLSGSSNPQIIGVKNGVYQGEIIWKNFSNKNCEKEIISYFIKKMNNSLDVIEQINFEIEYVEAYKSAKMTDFFRFTPALYGIVFFVSERVVEIFNNHRLPIHRYIPVNIYHKQIHYKYWALYIPQFYSGEVIAFDKSIFNKGSLLNKELISFNDYSEYKRAGYVLIEKLVFNKELDESLDIFLSSFLGHRYFVSEKLKIALEEIEVSGVNIGVSVHPKIDFE
jgi:hypothetical protein